MPEPSEMRHSSCAAAARVGDLGELDLPFDGRAAAGAAQ